MSDKTIPPPIDSGIYNFQEPITVPPSESGWTTHQGESMPLNAGSEPEDLPGQAEIPIPETLDYELPPTDELPPHPRFSPVLTGLELLIKAEESLTDIQEAIKSSIHNFPETTYESIQTSTLPTSTVGYKIVEELFNKD